MTKICAIFKTKAAPEYRRRPFHKTPPERLAPGVFFLLFETLFERVQFVVKFGGNAVSDLRVELADARDVLQPEFRVDVEQSFDDLFVEIEPVEGAQINVAINIAEAEAEAVEVYHVQDDEAVLVAESDGDVASFDVGSFSLFIVKATGLTDAEAALGGKR